MIILATITWYYFVNPALFGIIGPNDMFGPLTRSECAALQKVASVTDQRNGSRPKYECLPLRSGKP